MEPNCEQCSLTGVRVRSWGNTDHPYIMFVGEKPGREEISAGVSFAGESGQVMMEVLQNLNIPVDSCYFTNVVLCTPPEESKLDHADIACCTPRLEWEIKKTKPHLIVALGAVAAHVLFPDFNSFTKDAGRIFRSFDDCYGIVTLNLASILRSGGDVLFLDFLKHLRKALRWLEKDPQEDNPHTQVVVVEPDNDSLMQSVLSRLAEVQYLSYDWETTGLSVVHDRGFCLGMSWMSGTAVVLPIKTVHKYLQELYQAFSRPSLECVAYNGMFDTAFMEIEGLPPKLDWDPQLMHYALDERPQRRSQENLTADFLDAPRYETEMLDQYKTDKSEMLDTIPAEVIYEYCGKDADWCLRLFYYLKEELDRTPSLLRLHNEIFIPTTHLLRKMKRVGVPVDKDTLIQVSDNIESKLKILQIELRDIVGYDEFNPRSPLQVAEILWDKYGMTEPDLYNRKPRSTDKATLQWLNEKFPNHPFITRMLDYRYYNTLYTRYLKKIPDFLYEDSRVRPSYFIDRTETGRLSAADPPIQQFPRGVLIRQIFTPPEGYVFIEADYSQAEMRWAAHYGQDKYLINLFKSGVDFHSQMASAAYNIPLEEVTPEQRQAAKAVSFGLLYGMGYQLLANNTGLPTKEAKQFVQDYVNAVPGVQKWIRQTQAQVRNQRYVESVYGHRRRFPFITKHNLANLEREAVNAPIQASASTLNQVGAIELQKIFDQEYDGMVHICVLVHDNIIILCPDEEELVNEVITTTVQVMENAADFARVPFVVDVKVGNKGWGMNPELKKGKRYHGNYIK